MGRSPYSILGVPPDADEAALKAAWRQAALRYHPDRAGDDEVAKAALADAQWAMSVLKDPLRRAFYDRFGQDGDDLDLTPEAMRAMLQAGTESALRDRVPRSQCKACGGTGRRPSGRTCLACDPDLHAAPPPPPEHDPIQTGGRVRMPKAAPKRAAPAPSRVRVQEVESPKPASARPRIKPDRD